jgi:hypothetical protein
MQSEFVKTKGACHGKVNWSRPSINVKAADKVLHAEEIGRLLARLGVMERS